MAFKKYNDRSGKSAVTHYEAGDNFIRVRFGNAKTLWNPHKTYQWTKYGNGEEMIEQMKKLARSGRGLDDYIKENGMKNVSRVF